MTEIEFNTNLALHLDFLKSRALKFTKDHEDANDLVQETFLKAIRYYHQYHQGTNLRGWLFTILRNTFINHYNKVLRINKVMSSNENINECDFMMSASTNNAQSKFILDDVKRVISKLPEQYNKPFNLYFQGYQYQEIAKYMKMPLGTVKTNIFIARKILKKALAPYADRVN